MKANLNLRECIDKKDVSDYFDGIEDMKKALEYDSRQYICTANYRQNNYSMHKDVNWTHCYKIDCNRCPFKGEQRNLLKSMLPQLNEFVLSKYWYIINSYQEVRNHLAEKYNI
jgi:hypothetical protein